MNRITAKKMNISILGAALQMPYGRKPFLADRKAGAKGALEWWIPVCGRQQVGFQLPCALHLQDGTKPPEEMMDPVACMGQFFTRQDGTGEDMTGQDADWLAQLCQANGNVPIWDLGYFDNMLDPDPRIRKQNHEHGKRSARAATLLRERGLKTSGVTFFLGRNPNVDLDQNLSEFVTHVIPLFREITEQGNVVYLENCPMWGWNTTDSTVNNIANSPGMWVIIRELCRLHGVDVSKVKVTYDYSHTGLQRGRRGWTFRAMKAAGCADMLGRFHGKNLHLIPSLLAMWDAGGQIVLKGDRENGVPTNPGLAWTQYTGRHGQIGFCHYNPKAEADGMEENWYAQMYEARTVLGLDPEETVFHLELEDPQLRVKIRDEADSDGPADTDEQMQAKRDFMEAVVGISAGHIGALDAAADLQVQALALMAAHKITPPNSPPVEDLDLEAISRQADELRMKCASVKAA